MPRREPRPWRLCSFIAAQGWAGTALASVLLFQLPHPISVHAVSLLTAWTLILAVPLTVLAIRLYHWDQQAALARTSREWAMLHSREVAEPLFGRIGAR